MSDLLELIKSAEQGGPVILWDGAVGTQLMARGLTGKVPEMWNIDRPEALSAIHTDYLAAGSQVVQTNTFGATRTKLAMSGLEDKIEQVNQMAVQAARAAVDQAGRGLVAGDIGPCGQMLQPSGPLSESQALEVFKEQADLLVSAGADFISIETMFDLAEARAAVLAAKQVCNLTVVAHMTFSKTQRGFFTMMGVTPEDAVLGLGEAGADMVGANCNVAMPEMVELIGQMRAATDLPLIAQANAGDPQIVDGETVYSETPEAFAASAPALTSAGASAIGACCGSTPRFVAALRDKLGLSG